MNKQGLAYQIGAKLAAYEPSRAEAWVNSKSLDTPFGPSTGSVIARGLVGPMAGGAVFGGLMGGASALARNAKLGPKGSMAAMLAAIVPSFIAGDRVAGSIMRPAINQLPTIKVRRALGMDLPSGLE